MSKLQCERDREKKWVCKTECGRVRRGEEEVRDSLVFSTRSISIRLLMLLLFPFLLSARAHQSFRTVFVSLQPTTCESLMRRARYQNNKRTRKKERASKAVPMFYANGLNGFIDWLIMSLLHLAYTLGWNTRVQDEASGFYRTFLNVFPWKSLMRLKLGRLVSAAFFTLPVGSWSTGSVSKSVSLSGVIDVFESFRVCLKHFTWQNFILALLVWDESLKQKRKVYI